MRCLFLVVTLVVAGCTGSDEHKVPACSDVWVVGNRLPKGFDGCGQGDTIVGEVSIGCEDGGEVYAYESDGHWFVTDKRRVIHDGGKASNDPREFGPTVNSCP